MRKLLAFVLPALLAPATFVACSSGSSGDQVVYVYADGGKPTQGQDGSSNNQDTDGALKPSPQEIDASNVVDAAPPPRTETPDASKPTGAGDAGQLDAAVLADASPPPVTGDGDPLDPIDESLMPDYGFDEGVCTDYDLTKDTGRCYNDTFSGADYVEGCVSPDTYLLDCARYDTSGETRSICQDDGNTVGCVLIDVAQVATFEASQTDNFIDQSHACPSSWEGYGYCTDTYVNICQGGEDYWLDCSIYNSDGFTYTCGTDDNGNIACM